METRWYKFNSMNNSFKQDEYDKDGLTADGAASELGVPGRGKGAGTLTGTDRNKTGPGKNLATES